MITKVYLMVPERDEEGKIISPSHTFYERHAKEVGRYDFSDVADEIPYPISILEIASSTHGNETLLYFDVFHRCNLPYWDMPSLHEFCKSIELSEEYLNSFSRFQCTDSGLYISGCISDNNRGAIESKCMAGYNHNMSLLTMVFFLLANAFQITVEYSSTNMEVIDVSKVNPSTASQFLFAAKGSPYDLQEVLIIKETLRILKDRVLPKDEFERVFRGFMNIFHLSADTYFDPLESVVTEMFLPA